MFFPKPASSDEDSEVRRLRLEKRDDALKNSSPEQLKRLLGFLDTIGSAADSSDIPGC